MIDEKIVEELKRGDYRNFQTFYNQTSKNLFFTALLIIKDQHLAEDIVQESYVKFFKSISNVDVNQNIHYYLTAIARNLSLNEYNKRKKEISNEDMLLFKTGTYHIAKQDDGVEAILAVLDSDEEREIVVYHVLYEYKFKEISKLIDKPLGTVLWIYNQAMKKLRERTVL